MVSGTLIAILAGAIGMQVARVKDGKAAEQPGPSDAGIVKLESLGKPVSRINGQAITFEELAQECFERHGREVLENVINRTLIQQACAEAGVTVSAADVNQEIVRISKKFGLAQDQWEKMLEAERGLTPIQYRRDVIWPMLALKKLAGSQVQITRDSIQKAYDDAYGPRAKVRMIVLNNMRRATEVAAMVEKNPDEFENYAREYSVEPNSRALGGTVPPLRQHSGAHEELRKAAFKMKTPGAISGIIQTDVNQYVILRFEGLTEPISHEVADVEVGLAEDLRERQVQKMVADTFEKLKQNARIDNYLTGEVHQPVDQTSGPGRPALELESALGASPIKTR